MRYSSWISVSDFLLSVEADNEEEALKEMQRRLDHIIVTVTDKNGGYDTIEKLGCTITDVDKDAS